MNRFQFLLVLMASCCVNTVALGGGGWPQKKGHIYFKISQWWVLYNTNYDQFGHVVTDRSRAIYNTNLYVEYGITDKFTTIVYFPFYMKAQLAEEVDVSTGNVLAKSDEVSTLGDMEIAIKYGLFKNNRVAISTSFLLGIPLGVSQGGKDGTLWTGDGEFNEIVRLDLGGSFKLAKYYPYYNIYVGYNNRSKGFSNEIKYGLEFGSELNKFTIKTSIDVLKSLNNGTSLVSQNNPGYSINNSEYINFSVEFGYNFTKKLGVSGNYSKAIKGKLFYADPAYSVGVYVNLNRSMSEN